jgi:glycine/serine hydroxymethyltransferase
MEEEEMKTIACICDVLDAIKKKTYGQNRAKVGELTTRFPLYRSRMA